MRCFLALLIYLAAWLPAGCVREREVRSDWDSFAENMRGAGVDVAQGGNPKNEKKIAPANAPPPMASYLIPLATFEGSKRNSQAARLAKRLTDEFGLSDIRVTESGMGVTVYRGPYPHPEADIARRDLRQVQELEIDGQRAYEHARLAPAFQSYAAKGGEADISPHVGIAGLYTLYVGYYDIDFGPGYRRAAEKAVQTFRKQGEEAYFYHGPNVTLMTIGLFTRDDWSDEAGYGPRIKQAQERFPLLIGNGRTVVVTRNGEKVGEQQSKLLDLGSVEQ